MVLKFLARAVPVQVPFGTESELTGIVDLVDQVGLHFTGDQGRNMERVPIPGDLTAVVTEARERLLDELSQQSDEITALYLEGREIPAQLLPAPVHE